MGEQRAFKGVWIPAEVWLSDELTIYEKAVYAEIDSLDGENHCWASNEYLAEFCKMSVPTISRAISKLIQLGYIEKLSFDGRQRVLAVNKNISQIRETYLTDKSEISPSENLLLIENKKENNIKKAPETGASSKNHYQVYKKRESLNDDLESGKDIDEHEKSKKKSPKEKFKDECYSLIDNFVTDNHLDYAVHDLLIEYFDFISDIKQADGDNKRKVVRNTSTWETKLNNQLLKLIESGYNPIDIVRQSLDQKKYKFWEPDSQNNSGHETIQNNIKIRTLEEAKQDMQKKKERGVPTF